MGRLVEVAEEILRNAKTLEAQLESASAPPRTLESGGPLLYPKCKEMYQLAQGPNDTIRFAIGPEMMEAFVFNVIERYNIASNVPQTGSISFEDLAAKISVHPGLLERIMRFAFSINVFKPDDKGNIAHTALSEAIPNVSHWSWFMNMGEVIAALSSWPDSLAVYSEPRTPGNRQLPWNIGNDMDTSFFDHLKANPAKIKRFGQFMASAPKAVGGDLSFISSGFDWASLGPGPVVDLGGGHGHISILLANDFPDLHVVVQDLPASEEGANNLIPANLKNRVSFQAQDFFKPQEKDLRAKAFFLKSVMHDWPDDDCMSILQILLPEVERGAKIVLCDKILPSRERKPSHMESFFIFMDLLMFSLLGAKERSVDQWKTLVHKTDPRLKVLSITQPAGSEFGMIVVGM